MEKIRLSGSLRKFIREEKARIRRSAVGAEEKLLRVRELIAKYHRAA